ncbi:hypothetical protein OC861_000335 [Tilletia horrida]|nr:hypothetical protein OC861_000335 [Tilletia horrida]
MSRRAGPSRIRIEDEEPSIASGRAKRSTAGNRISALLKSGLEPEELFEEVADDAEYLAPQAPADIIDSDFDESTDEDIPEDEADRELEAQEKAARKAERRKTLPTALRVAQAQKTAIRVPESAVSRSGTTRSGKVRRDMSEMVKTSRQEGDDDGSPSLEPLRSSKRDSTRVKTLTVAKKLRAAEERAAKRVKREPARSRPKMTQDALIAEALEMEELNRESLRAYLEQEEDRKAKARAPKRTVIEGPFIRWLSIAICNQAEDGDAEAGPASARAKSVQINDPQTSTSARAVTADDATLTQDPVLAARAEATRQRTGQSGSQTRITQDPDGFTLPRSGTYSRNLVSLHDLDENLTWFQRQEALFGDHCDWDLHEVVPPRNRPAQPKQSICPITGLPALYRDPHTGVAFATAEAQQILMGVLENEYIWTGSLGEAMLNVGCWIGHEDEEGAAGVVKRARELAKPRAKGAAAAAPPSVQNPTVSFANVENTAGSSSSKALQSSFPKDASQEGTIQSQAQDRADPPSGSNPEASQP